MKDSYFERQKVKDMLDKKKVKLGIAPIGWTNDDMPDLGKENTFQQCVSEMALAGFTGSEVGGKYPTDVETLKKALDLRGIQICNCWFSSFLISRPYEETEKEFIKQTDFLKAMGAKVIGVSEQSYSIQGKDQPIFEGKYVMNDEEWKLLTDGLNKLGQIAKDKGMMLTFHHHMGTVVQDPDEVERMMANTDPEYVSLLFDTGHFTYCGADPLEMVKKYVNRIKHVHLKDIRPEVVKEVKDNDLSFLEGVRRGAFTVPGDGCIDFDPIFKVLEENGYEGYMLVEAEQDPAKANPLEYAIKARKFIREKTGL
jgi:inosose dehydratase